VPGGGADCRFILILNKLLKILDAQNYQNAGNAVLEYATSTRDFLVGDSSKRTSEFDVAAMRSNSHLTTEHLEYHWKIR